MMRMAMATRIKELRYELHVLTKLCIAASERNASAEVEYLSAQTRIRELEQLIAVKAVAERERLSTAHNRIQELEALLQIRDRRISAYEDARDWVRALRFGVLLCALLRVLFLCTQVASSVRGCMPLNTETRELVRAAMRRARSRDYRGLFEVCEQTNHVNH